MELICKNCGKNPGHNDVGVECYECHKPWCAPHCNGCGEIVSEQSLMAGECEHCGEDVG